MLSICVVVAGVLSVVSIIIRGDNVDVSESNYFSNKLPNLHNNCQILDLMPIIGDKIMSLSFVHPYSHNIVMPVLNIFI